jgi:UDP-N-acetylmuramoyl-L-alanyl-D-glutamate--2,6-diaminopimelate ligase
MVAAAACAVALGLPPESIPAGVLALDRVPGRVEKIDCGQPFTVVVDYAHTPAALERLLGWLREITRGRLVVVFGCGGARDRDKRPLMGRAAARLADEVVLTSDNPRNEEPEAILAEIAQGVSRVAGGAQRTRTIPERRQAIAAAIAAARAGDVVVIAGKGHATTQIVGDRVLPFDDRTVAAECLESAGFGKDGHARA